MSTTETNKSKSRREATAERKRQAALDEHYQVHDAAAALVARSSLSRAAIRDLYEEYRKLPGMPLWGPWPDLPEQFSEQLDDTIRREGLDNLEPGVSVDGYARRLARAVVDAFTWYSLFDAADDILERRRWQERRPAAAASHSNPDD